MRECALAASQLGLGLIGGRYDGKVVKNVVYRSTIPAKQPTDYPCIIAANDIDSGQQADLITVANFRRIKDKARKKVRRKQGLEFLLHPARQMTAAEVAKWLGELREAYGLCQALGAQFILSSGAGSPSEMISGNSFDEILKEIGIDPRRHWQELNRWLDHVIAGQVMV